MLVLVSYSIDQTKAKEPNLLSNLLIARREEQMNSQKGVRVNNLNTGH